ncbi:MAG: hypothetical protein ACUVT7_03320 [Thermoplasmata archaeon]
MPKRADVGLLAIVTTIVLAVAFATAIQPQGSTGPGESRRYLIDFGAGSMHINDAGRSHGGFEYAAEYDVTVYYGDDGPVPVGGTVNIVFSLSVGLGDVLRVHSLQLSVAYLERADTIVLYDGGSMIRLVKVEEDLIWDHRWDGYYIASWGGDAPENEIRGQISPAVFGLPDHYYVELRLWAQVMFTL